MRRSSLLWRLMLMERGRRASGAVAATVTWNPADTGANITFTNGNLDASKVSASGSWTVTRATVAKSTGKRYFELTLLTSTDFHTFGVADATASLSAGLGSGGGEAYGMDNRTHQETLTGSFTDFSDTFPTLAVNDVVGIAIDLDAGKMWMAKNNNFAAYIAGGNPATATQPLATFTPNLTLFPAAGLFGGGGGDVGVRLAASGTFVSTPPSGFVAWNA